MKLPGDHYIIKVYGVRPVDVTVTILVIFMLV